MPAGSCYRHSPTSPIATPSESPPEALRVPPWSRRSKGRSLVRPIDRVGRGVNDASHVPHASPLKSVLVESVQPEGEGQTWLPSGLHLQSLAEKGAGRAHRVHCQVHVLAFHPWPIYVGPFSTREFLTPRALLSPTKPQ